MIKREMKGIDPENMSEEDQVMFEIKKNEKRTIKMNWSRFGAKLQQTSRCENLKLTFVVVL